MSPYERHVWAETLEAMSPEYAKRVEALAPRPHPSLRLRGLIECVTRNNKLRRERQERRKFDRDLGL